MSPVNQGGACPIRRIINSIDKIQLRDNTLHDIVLEIVGAYFAGDKTLDDTVALVQNRATLYVNENR